MVGERHGCRCDNSVARPDPRRNHHNPAAPAADHWRSKRSSHGRRARRLRLPCQARRDLRREKPQAAPAKPPAFVLFTSSSGGVGSSAAILKLFLCDFDLEKSSLDLEKSSLDSWKLPAGSPPSRHPCLPAACRRSSQPAADLTWPVKDCALHRNMRVGAGYPSVHECVRCARTNDASRCLCSCYGTRTRWRVCNRAHANDAMMMSRAGERHAC